MKRHIAQLLCAVTALGLGATARAGFVNGGFETGDFTGWTVEHSIANGQPLNNLVYSALALPSSHAQVIGNVPDPYSPFDTVASIGAGNYMAQLNEINRPIADVTRIRQTATMNAGETALFINWGAVLEDPSHSLNQQPQFEITVLVNNVIAAQEIQNASQGATDGWVAGPIGPNGSPTYHKSAQFHLQGLVANDSVEVILTIADCSATGHAGWAYLDGVGNIAQPPPGTGVPDSGSTAALLIPALLGLIALRRRK
jgi:hypothetical protein